MNFDGMSIDKYFPIIPDLLLFQKLTKSLLQKLQKIFFQMSFKTRINNIKSYTLLNNVLMSKLQQTPQRQNYPTDQLGFSLQPQQYRYSQNDYLMELSKSVNNSKFINSTGKYRTSNNKNNTFLTGVQMIQDEPVQQIQRFMIEEEVKNDNYFLKQVNNYKIDDLAQLRRMIKQTDTKLNKYGYSLNRTKNQVYDAAEKIGKTVDFKLTYKIENESQYLPKLQSKDGNRKRSRKQKTLKLF